MYKSSHGFCSVLRVFDLLLFSVLSLFMWKAFTNIVFILCIISTVNAILVFLFPNISSEFLFPLPLHFVKHLPLKGRDSASFQIFVLHGNSGWHFLLFLWLMVPLYTLVFGDFLLISFLIFYLSFGLRKCLAMENEL